MKVTLGPNMVDNRHIVSTLAAGGARIVAVASPAAQLQQLPAELADQGLNIRGLPRASP